MQTSAAKMPSKRTKETGLSCFNCWHSGNPVCGKGSISGSCPSCANHITTSGLSLNDESRQGYFRLAYSNVLPNPNYHHSIYYELKIQRTTNEEFAVRHFKIQGHLSSANVQLISQFDDFILGIYGEGWLSSTETKGFLAKVALIRGYLTILFSTDEGVMGNSGQNNQFPIFSSEGLNGQLVAFALSHADNILDNFLGVCRGEPPNSTVTTAKAILSIALTQLCLAIESGRLKPIFGGHKLAEFIGGRLNSLCDELKLEHCWSCSGTMNWTENLHLQCDDLPRILGITNTFLSFHAHELSPFPGDFVLGSSMTNTNTIAMSTPRNATPLDYYGPAVIANPVSAFASPNKEQIESLLTPPFAFQEPDSSSLAFSTPMETPEQHDALEGNFYLVPDGTDMQWPQQNQFYPASNNWSTRG